MRNLDLLMDVRSLLDEAERCLHDRDPVGALSLLSSPLAELIDAARRQDLRRRLIELVRRHPLQGLLLQDPLTNLAHQHARRAPCDTALQDLIESGSAPAGTSALGLELFRITVESSAAESLRVRPVLLGERIAAIHRQHGDIRVLAIGAGDGRELPSTALEDQGTRIVYVGGNLDRAGHRGRIRASLELRNAPASAFGLSRHVADAAPFDLIYAPSLLDHAPDRAALRLVRTLLPMLRPRGKLVLCNLTTECESRGYIEAVMQRPVQARHPGRLRAIFRDTGARTLSTKPDPSGNVLFIDIQA